MNSTESSVWRWAPNELYHQAFQPKRTRSQNQSRLRRVSSAPSSEDQQVVNLKGFFMNLLSHEVRVNNQRVDLTPKEFDLLWHLASNRDRVFTREQLLRHVWDMAIFWAMSAQLTNM